MSTTDITRAWKDCAFRDSLTDEQRALVPAHPAGASAACDGLTQSPEYCSWFCGSSHLFKYGDTTYGCYTPGRTL
jgi:mersacidin/lichenicidin family type 2 lantibiotic